MASDRFSKSACPGQGIYIHPEDVIKKVDKDLIHDAGCSLTTDGLYKVTSLETKDNSQ